MWLRIACIWWLPIKCNYGHIISSERCFHGTLKILSGHPPAVLSCQHLGMLIGFPDWGAAQLIVCNQLRGLNANHLARFGLGDLWLGAAYYLYPSTTSIKGQDTRFTAKSVNCSQFQSTLSLAIVRSGKWWLVMVAIECLGTSHVNSM
jgi:hypothetical protein